MHVCLYVQVEREEIMSVKRCAGHADDGVTMVLDDVPELIHSFWQRYSDTAPPHVRLNPYLLRPFLSPIQ